MTEFGNLVGPLAQSVLYLRDLSFEASPKAISGRTSYLRVRLAFHPYPQLIPRLFNDQWVRASTEFYLSFTLAMGRSPGFGSTPTYSYALFRLAFAAAPASQPLTLLASVTRRSVLQKVRRQLLKRAPTACKHTVSGSISLPSRGAFHLSLTVLVHYRSPGSI